jgi:hypothetical protein
LIKFSIDNIENYYYYTLSHRFNIKIVLGNVTTVKQ